MKDFLRDNWLWIVLPFVIVVAAVVFFLVFMDDQGASPFTYGQ
ncbi:MAG: hypothetical protein P1V81_06850 [Planctomycetota bacterium]|nr:hypothetical protein [Planctomycetota bacterium]